MCPWAERTKRIRGEPGVGSQAPLQDVARLDRRRRVVKSVDMIWKAALLAIFLLFSQVAAATEAVAPTVSVSDILKNPDAYAGKSVRLHGFLILEFEGNGLWQDEKAFRGELYEQSLWIDSSGLSEAQKEAVTGRLAYLSGTFNPANHGHLGMRPGAVEQVTAIERDPSDTGPARPGRTEPEFALLFGLLIVAAGITAMLALGAYGRRATTRTSR